MKKKIRLQRLQSQKKQETLSTNNAKKTSVLSVLSEKQGTKTRRLSLQKKIMVKPQEDSKSIRRYPKIKKEDSSPFSKEIIKLESLRKKQSIESINTISQD